MLKLLHNEFRKFKGSYINTVAFAAMLFPTLFTAFTYYFTNGFAFRWDTYIGSLHLFYGVFLGAFVPSFIAIFSVHTELKNGTMKNMVASPHSRLQIITAKTLYVMLFVAGLYIGVGVLVLASGLIIGLPTVASDIWRVLKLVTFIGITTTVLVPMMIYVTLLFRNFVVPLVITFLGIVVGIPLINMGQSYFYPWMLPSNFFFRLRNPEGMDFTGPVLLLLLIPAVFYWLSVLRFRKMDFDI